LWKRSWIYDEGKVKGNRSVKERRRSEKAEKKRNKGKPRKKGKTHSAQSRTPL
jgi:hypothetical protein